MRRRRDQVDWPARLKELLPTLPLFEGLTPRELNRVLRHLQWFSLPGGWTLMERGQEGDDLFVVTAGSLGMLLPNGNGGTYMAGQLGPGDTVGEVSILLGEPRHATLVALRDTELLRISQPAFHEIAERYPKIMENIARAVARRVGALMDGRRDPGAFQRNARTFAIIRLHRDMPHRDITEGLIGELTRGGKHVALLDKADREADTEWFHRFEAEHHHVVYLGSLDDEHWTRLCLRQADRVILLGWANPPPPDLLAAEQLMTSGPRRFLELVLVHPADAPHATGAEAWLERLKPDFHHNVRKGNTGDIARVARHLGGEAVGVVLAGGGARGFAHLGVLRALHEAGITIDLLGGTSMGAIIGAGIALDWTQEELEGRMRASFVDVNPLDDYTIPRISFVRGRKVVRLLQDNFGEARIEETWRNFFCVASNLTTGREAVHRTGPIWQALRASVAIPGVLPPVVRAGQVLVDGAVMNNFPADIMAAMGRGPIIGIDLEAHNVFVRQLKPWEDGPDWGVMGETLKGGPGIVSLLMRSGTVNSAVQNRLARGQVDLLFSPPVEDIGIRAWRAFDEAIEAGYAHAMSVLEDADLSAFRR